MGGSFNPDLRLQNDTVSVLTSKLAENPERDVIKPKHLTVSFQIDKFG